jgi:chaperonin GroES
VVAVGPGKDDEAKPSVSVGDSVLYSKYSGTEFEGEDSRQYIVVRDADILAVLA